MRRPLPQSPLFDARITAIAAGSFLFHFGAFAALYSEWGDLSYDNGIVIDSVIASIRELPAVPEETREEVADGAPAEAAPRVSDEAPGKRGARALPQNATRGPDRAIVRPTRPTLSSELDRFQADMLAALGSSTASTDHVLDSATLPISTLRDPALGSSTTGSPFAAGMDGPELARTRGCPDCVDRKPERDICEYQPQRLPAPPQPTVSPNPGPIGPHPDPVPIWGRLQWVFRRCYERALKTDPEQRGSVRIVLKIGANGEVISAFATAPTGNLSPSLVNCLTTKAMTFDLPATGDLHTVVIPVRMEPQ
ncbi:MAG: hypothetical protein U0271_43830 [Polyangiaceae bacterium]